MCQEFSSVSALELLVRANITVKSSIKHLVLRDAAAQVLSRAHVCLQNPLKQNDDISSLSVSSSLQVPVMIYPEPGLADQYLIPWWIILIAVLAGILLLTLLVCILWKVTHTHAHAHTHSGYIHVTAFIVNTYTFSSHPEYLPFNLIFFRTITVEVCTSHPCHVTGHLIFSYHIP